MRIRGLEGRVGGRQFAVLQYWLVCVLVCNWLSVVPVASSHQILWGRCYSYCIKEHLAKHAGDDVAALSLPKRPIRACERNQTCRWCLYVCERPEENFTNSESCLRDCRYTRTRPRSEGRKACTDACGFVGRASSAKGGTCPAPVSLTGFQSACVASCHGDRDCTKAEEKCCSNDCGSVCTAPYDLDILPPVPSKISFKLLKTGGVLVKWGLGGSDKANGQAVKPWRQSPVVFILRWWCPYTSGALTSVTDRPRARLQGYPTGIYPGSKCHFMVAAVNMHGSRGFSKVSPYIKQFLTPSPPLNLDKTKSSMHDGKVDVTLQWQPPVYTDGLPVDKYQVFWSDSLPRASPNYMRLHMHRRIVGGDITTFVLHNLEPGTIYFVQVRAVVKWKSQQKRGKPASAYIEVYSPPQTHGSTPRPSIVTDPDMDSIIQSVNVNQTFFHDTILKAAIHWTLVPNKTARKYLIYWRLEMCARNEHRKAHHRSETSATSHEPAFSLYNLQPDCEYSVRVHPVNVKGRTGAATVTNFLTPPCHLIKVTQGKAPTCHTADPPGRVEGLHSETSRCVTVLRWLPPTSRGAQVHTYDVMWGETEAGAYSTATVIYSSAPEQFSVPGNVTHVQLGKLTAGQHYTVQVSATSLGGSSRPAILSLVAPASEESCRGTDDLKDHPGSTTTATTTTTTDDTTIVNKNDSSVSHNTSSPSPKKATPTDAPLSPLTSPPTPSTKDLSSSTASSIVTATSGRSRHNTDTVVGGDPAGSTFSINTQPNATNPTPTSTHRNAHSRDLEASTVSTHSARDGVTLSLHPSTPSRGTDVKGASVTLQASFVTLLMCLLFLGVCS
ncbi:anosmin-1-like [Littorina saxatilis]|uniref:Anosmin-1 n=1 Tax=Littorina saxatilis TaxID=31220 RepID=A0AAN9G0K2_9CAEN